MHPTRLVMLEQMDGANWEQSKNRINMWVDSREDSLTAYKHCCCTTIPNIWGFSLERLTLLASVSKQWAKTTHSIALRLSLSRSRHIGLNPLISQEKKGRYH